MKTDRVKYYYKDLKTGVEMTFSKTEQWGWVAGFHTKTTDEAVDALLSDIVIPWPTLSESEQRVVDANYDKLYKSLEDD